jgi:hypothetical protein
MVQPNNRKKFGVVLEMGIDGNMMFKDSEITGGQKILY